MNNSSGRSILSSPSDISINTASTPTANGYVNGQASPLSDPQHLAPLFPHLHTAFATQLFPDTNVYVGQFPCIRAHAVILSRSTVLRMRLLQTQSLVPHDTGYSLTIPMVAAADSLYLTHAALVAAIEYLYTCNTQPIQAQIELGRVNALGLIAACSILSITTPELLVFLRKACIDTYINAIQFTHLFAFLTCASSPPSGPYPPFTSGLMDIMATYILHEHIPNELNISMNNTALVALLVKLPFDILKQTLESPDLAVKSDHARYLFAKEIVALRQPSKPHHNNHHIEESVVLAFGGGAKGVELLAKPIRRKKKP